MSNENRVNVRGVFFDNVNMAEAVEKAIENSEEWTEPFSVEKGR